MSKVISTTIIFLFFIVNAFSQLSTKENPISFKEQIKDKDIPIITMPNLDLGLVKNEEILDSISGFPPRFGFDFDVNIDLLNSGRWKDLPNKKGRLWQLMISCPDALSINLLYDSFHIPEGGKFFVYGKNKKKVLGAFTKRNNKGNMKKPGSFATSLILSDRIVLEYFEPNDMKGESVISIAKVVHGYKYIKVDKLFGDSGNCNVNINCPQGDNWQDEKTSVALIIVGGTRWCTGSLINNTGEDGTPYLLTADHCLESSGLDAISNPTASNWTFLWNYESIDCEDGADFNPPSTSGATVVANNSASDFALLELDESPYDLEPSLCLFYSGWSRSTSAPPNTTCIHHPSGDIKKISIDNDSPSSDGNYWKVNDWDTGTTEGGSSGSPLFDNNQRVIGQLKGGDAACGNDLHDIYGKLSVSWNNSTDRRRRLKDWLDPLGTGPITLNGAYLFPANNTNIAGSNLVCNSENYSINNLPSGATISWTQSSNLTRSSSQGSNPCSFSANGSGFGWVEATISTGCGDVTLQRKDVRIGSPVTTFIVGSMNPSPHQTETYYATGDYYPEYPSAFDWSAPGASSVEEYGDHAQIRFSSPGFYTISVKAYNGCGWGNEYSLPVQVMGYYSMSISPNPTSGEAEIAIDTPSEESVLKSGSIGASEQSKDVEWDLEVYNQGQLLKAKKTKIKSKSHKINTRGWKEGVYIVKVKVNDEIITGKLVVQK